MITLILIQTFTQLCFWFQPNKILSFTGLQIRLTICGTESVLLSFYKIGLHNPSLFSLDSLLEFRQI